jgi:hypothetical protein
MCEGRSWRSMGVVDGQPIVIRLEVHVEDDSVTGHASDVAGAGREFVGWMGLVAAIDALVKGNSPAEGVDSTTVGDGEAAS